MELSGEIISGGLIALGSFAVGAYKDYILSFLSDHLSFRRETRLTNYKDKIRLYQETIDQLSPVLNALESLEVNDGWDQDGGHALMMQHVYPLRIQIISRISLFAPDNVVSACMDFMNYLFYCCRGNLKYDNDTLCILGDEFLDAIRKDIGIGKEKVRFDTDQDGTFEALVNKLAGYGRMPTVIE